MFRGRSQRWAGATGFADFDNDGRLDLFVANGHVYPEIDRSGRGMKYLQRKQLFKNLGQGHFRDVSEEVGGGLLIEKSSRGAAFADSTTTATSTSS